jgi:hypothetical protein
LINLDVLATGQKMKEQLGRLAGWQSSEPFIFIDGVHIGGADELRAASKTQMLPNMLKAANITHLPFTDPASNDSMAKKEDCKYLGTRSYTNTGSTYGAQHATEKPGQDFGKMNMGDYDRRHD